MKSPKLHLSPAMPKLLIALVASVAALSLSAGEPRQARLLVNIMVEGLDADYLDLLRDRFGDDGFRRLEREGVSLTADYGTSLDATAATALINTGAAPSLSGVGARSHYDRDRLMAIETYADDDVPGNYTNSGYSPRKLRVTTIADEARIASGGTNVSATIAATPGMAVSMAGHTGGCVLWLDQRTGNWASSTAYGDMPSAVAARNRMTPLTVRLDTMSWTPLLAPADYPALPDHLTRYPFRYVFPAGKAERLDMFASSPMFNREVTALAGELINNQHLGTHEGVTDVLNLAYTLEPFAYGKSADKRPELMDAYVRLDRNLGRLFAQIDRAAGPGNSVVVLSATPPRPLRRRDEESFNIPYGEFSTRRAVSLLNIYLIALYGNGDYVSAYHNGHLFLNQKLIKERKLDAAQVRSEAAAFMARMTGIDRVHTVDDIIAGRAGEHAEALRRNTVAATAGDLLVEIAPGFEIVDDYNQADPAKASTGHVRAASGTTAPVFIMAPSVAPQTVALPVDARAIAPTVARLLRIRSPNGASAAPLKLGKK